MLLAGFHGSGWGLWNPNQLKSGKRWLDAFLGETYPHFEVHRRRMLITNFAQEEWADFYEAYDIFRDAVLGCPNHRYTNEELAMIFYSGLKEKDREMVDSVTGGISDQTAARTRCNLWKNS